MTDQTAIKALTKRNGRRAVLAMVRDWAGIGIAIGLAVWADSVPVTIICMWVIGAFQHALGGVLIHEGAHGNLFADKALNDRIDPVCGWPFLITMERYKIEHLRHHGQLGKPGGDYLVDEYLSFGLNRPRNRVWIWLIRPMIFYPACHYLAKLPTFPRKSLIRLALFWSAATALFALSGLFSEFLLYWVVPLLWCRYAFLYWNEVADHYATIGGVRTRKGLVGNWIEHNRGFHLAHHRYPSVPWFNLKKAHALMEETHFDDQWDGYWLDMKGPAPAR